MADLLPSGFVFHQSNLQAFQTCRYSFLLRYVRKMPWPAPLAERTVGFEKDLLAGSTLHSMIHQFFLGIDPKLLISCATDFPDARVAFWFSNFLNSEYAKHVPQQYPEHSLQITLDGSLLLAKFDLLTVTEDTIEIYDWKTSRNQPKRRFLQDRIQTKVYSLIASRSLAEGHRSVKMHYWEASYPENSIAFEFDPEQLDKHQEELTDLIRCVRSLPEERFERTPDTKRCSYCEYQSYCARTGAPGDEESLQAWYEIGLNEFQETNNQAQIAF